MRTTTYREWLKELDREAFLREMRAKLVLRLTYGSHETCCNEIWWEAEERGMGQLFLDTLAELRKERTNR